MARKRGDHPLTPLELEIMKVLWDRGHSTVQAVQRALPSQPPLAYTTVQTMLNVLLKKGRVRRTLHDRAYEYRASIGRLGAARQTVGDLIDRMFGGSTESLVLSLIETRRLTPERLAELSRLVAEEAEADDE